MDPISMILSIFGLGSQIAGGIGKYVAQAGATTAMEALGVKSDVAQREGLKKRQAMETTQEGFIGSDLVTQKGETEKLSKDIYGAKGLIDSGIFEDQLTKLSKDLAKTLNRRATMFGMKQGYENWALDTELGLKKEAQDIQNKFGEDASAWGVLGDVGSMSMGAGQYYEGIKTSEKMNALLNKQLGLPGGGNDTLGGI